MTARTVLKWPNPLLKNITEPVEVIDDSIVKLVQDMSDTMRVEFGLGLAATQVGFDHSIAVLKSSFHTVSPLKVDPVVKDCIVLVNPKIEVLGEATFRWAEACLSVPGIEEVVERHRDIRLTYTDLSNTTHTVELNNENSGLVQHEVDHLFGKLFIDRLKKGKQRQVLSLLRRSIRSAALSRVKEAKKAKREKQAERDAEETRPGFRKNPVSHLKKTKRPAKKFGKTKRRRKK